MYSNTKPTEDIMVVGREFPLNTMKKQSSNFYRLPGLPTLTSLSVMKVDEWVRFGRVRSGWLTWSRKVEYVHKANKQEQWLTLIYR